MEWILSNRELEELIRNTLLEYSNKSIIFIDKEKLLGKIKRKIELIEQI